MPALQVRDFPADLYEDLKNYAAREHRSMAQQTIKAVEEMLQREGEAGATKVIEFDSLAARQRRIEKRKAIFERIGQNSRTVVDHIPDAAEVVKRGREERDEHLCEIMGLVSAIDAGTASEAMEAL